MRGLAILLVVLGHSIGIITEPLNRFILSFHMPVFFFVSGLVLNCRQITGEMLPFKLFLIKKAKSILTLWIVLFALNIFFDIVAEHEVFTIDLFLNNLFNWFLIVLFYVVILFYILEKTILVVEVLPLLLMIVCLVVVTQILGIKTVAHIETIPMAILFLLLGHYCKKPEYIHTYLLI